MIQCKRKLIRDPSMQRFVELRRKSKFIAYEANSIQAKSRKNIETDLMGDKMGRIHVGRQDLNQLQTRKMKGLKRKGATTDDYDLALTTNGIDVEESDIKRARRADSV